MINHKHYLGKTIGLGAILVAMSASLVMGSGDAGALTRIKDPAPKAGGYGLAAVKKQAPPTTAPTITSPRTGAGFSNSPVTVSGICETDLLVQIYNNGVMVGSVMCRNKSFSIRVSLFPGRNQFTAAQLDDLEQAGPTSNQVTVRYTDTNFTGFGKTITLTSSYGRRAAPTGGQLTWPLQLTGGLGPYAFSIDWGDGSKVELKSQSLAGVVNIVHSYKKAGIYVINVSVVDSEGVSAFLQLTAVSTGKVDGAATTGPVADKCQEDGGVRIIWIPSLLALIMLPIAYWLGRRSQLVSIRNKMLKERDQYEDR